jgi:hypothetical protein
MTSSTPTKENGPASPASDPDLGSSKPLKGMAMNAKEDSSITPVRQDEHFPSELVGRLCDELSEALDGYMDGSKTAVVMPASSTEFPIHIVIARDHNRMMRALYDYKRAHARMLERFEAYKSLGGPLRGLLANAISCDDAGYFDAKHECDLAHMALIDCFEAPVMIEGEAA